MGAQLKKGKWCVSLAKLLCLQSKTLCRNRCSHHIDKSKFLSIYVCAHTETLSASNIHSGFRATGLIPLNAEEVLARLQIMSRRAGFGIKGDLNNLLCITVEGQLSEGWDATIFVTNYHPDANTTPPPIIPTQWQAETLHNLTELRQQTMLL
jgi:hypothetical protein